MCLQVFATSNLVTFKVVMEPLTLDIEYTVGWEMDLREKRTPQKHNAMTLYTDLAENGENTLWFSL